METECGFESGSRCVLLLKYNFETQDTNDIINGIDKQMNDENADGEGEKTTDKDELNDTKLEKNDNSKNSKTK